MVVSGGQEQLHRKALKLYNAPTMPSTIRPRTALLALLLALPGASACRARLTAAELADPAITARVKAVLDGHPELDIRYLDLNTHMRIVTLSGMVESRDSKQRITDLVRRVAGVRQVVVNLAVQE
ncbi:BON domain-containing protein [bacterium]|nr:MAG: BON domain-containing protein [bacterium]